MKEANVVLYDITNVFSENQSADILNSATDDITHCIVYEYNRVFHSFLGDIVGKSMSHHSQCMMVLGRVATQYGILTSKDPVAELKRRLPHIYTALLGHIESIVSAMRNFIVQHVPIEFSKPISKYRAELTSIRTKTWGDKHFLTYSREVESLKWPSVLSK